MWRREFIVGLGGAAAWPAVARAQQPTMPVIGYLSGRMLGDSVKVLAGFRRGLAETGFSMKAAQERRRPSRASPRWTACRTRPRQPGPTTA